MTAVPALADTLLANPVLADRVMLAAESPPVVPVVGELIIGFIGFGILCFILMRFVFPKMEQMYRARVDAIEGGIRRAEEAQEQAQELLRQYNAQLAEARSDATRIRDEARVEGHQILAELRAQAQEESERIVARGEQQLASSRQQLLTELRGEIGKLSVDLASRIVGESLADEARRAGTVQRFLDGLQGLDELDNDRGRSVAQSAGGR
ncbi:MAG TPA: F0F1 ATP synthase subunit B [Mycobacteriales bacterium]|jgi:F-type H+-transporting ATPase subunit b|nr:F0F1 ATP synthase subunit B [Mycobacteriales bacterium]